MSRNEKFSSKARFFFVLINNRIKKKKLASILFAMYLTIPTNMIRITFLIFLDISSCQMLFHKVCITSNQSVIMLVDKSFPRPFAGNVAQHKDVNANVKAKQTGRALQKFRVWTNTTISCGNVQVRVIRLLIVQLSHLHSFVRNNCRNLET